MVLPLMRGITASVAVFAAAGATAFGVVTVAAPGTSAATVRALASSPAPTTPSPSGGPVYNCAESSTPFTRSIPMRITTGFLGGDTYGVTLTSGPDGLGGMSGTAQYPDFQSFLSMTGAQSEGIDMYGGYTDPGTGVFSVSGEVALYIQGTDYIHFPDTFTIRPGTPDGGSTYVSCQSAVSPAPVAVTVGASPSPSAPSPSPS